MPTRYLSLIVAVLLLLPGALAAQRAPPRPLVVIDAGHGGADPGARGPGGTREKDVALGVARELAEILRDGSQFDVRLTRDRDTLIALADRPRLANRWRAEGGEDRPALFMSIHANAHRSGSARGFETYFLSDAKTEDARRVEAMENSAQQYEDSGDAPDDELSFIFQDLRQNLYLRESSSWADLVQRRLAPGHPGPDRGVKQAGFVVLNGAFMPAVLVELGFITNPQEERLLSSRPAQRQMAESLARAVADYFEQSAQSVAGR